MRKIKNQKFINQVIITSLVANSIPFNVINIASAKESADIWSFENKNTSFHFTTEYASWTENMKKTAFTYNNPVTPISFNVPEETNGQFPLEFFGSQLNNRSIQYVSFVDTTHLKNIGKYYWVYYGTETWSEGGSFMDNEIRKIYWNKSDAYLNNIRIGHYAFKNNKIQNLDLPNKITSIGVEAFANNEITWIEGWENVTELESGAFANNRLVSSLPNGYTFEIPNKLTTLTHYVFKDNQLTYVEVPENILSVGIGVFNGNPLKSIYFKNPNTAIAVNMLSPDASTYHYRTIEGLTVYGHGDTSTAKQYADSVGYPYVNVDQYEHAVFDAEESKTQAKIATAYDKVNEMEDGEMKDGYLKRLNEINLSFDIENYVIKAEESLYKTDYDIALRKVKTIESDTLRIPYERRLDLVLKGINGAVLAEVKTILGGDTSELTLKEIDDYKKTLLSLEQNSEILDLINKLNQETEAASLNSYKMANSYLEYTKANKTLKHVLETQKLINELPDGYKVTQPVTLTYTEEFLLDGDGNKIIDEDASYKKTTDGSAFELDVNGDKILNDGLTGPIYLADSLYGQTYTVNEERGSKNFLQSELDEFDDLVYAKAAVDVARKYMTEEKLQEALLLTFILEDGHEKTDLLRQIGDLDDEINDLADIKEEAEARIKKYGRIKDNLGYNSAKTYIESNFHNEKLKESYLDLLEQEKYIIQINDIIEEGKVRGLTDVTMLQLIAKLSLIAEDHEKYSDIIKDSEELLNEYNYYNVTYLEISKKIDAAKKDPNSTIEKYREIQAEVINVKENNPNKSDLTSELSSLFKTLNDSAETKYKYDLIKEEIDFNKTNVDLVSPEDIEVLRNNIKAIESKEQRDELNKELNELIEKIIKEYLIVEMKKPGNDKKEYKDEILKFNVLSTDADKKKEIKSLIDETLYGVLIEGVNINFSSPDIFMSNDKKADGGLVASTEDILKLIEASDKQSDVLTLIDDKKIDLIRQIEEKGDSGDLSNELLNVLSKLFNSINNLDKKDQQESIVKNIVNDYFTESYPNYYQEGAYTLNDYKDMSHLINNFDGIHFNDISQDQIDNNIAQFLDQSFDDNRIWDAGTLNQTIEDIGAIVNQNVQANMSNILESNFHDYLQSIDLSKTNSLETLTRLGDEISKISNSDTKIDLIEGMTSYLQDNAQTIYDVAKQVNNEQAYIQFLEDYVSQDTINKLIQNDNDNVVGKQDNKNQYYEDIINNLQGDVDKLQKALDHLEEIMKMMNGKGNQMIDSSTNTIGNKQGGFDLSSNGGNMALNNLVTESILKELGFKESLENNNMLINDLKDEIENLKEENKELFQENILSLKASGVEEDENVKRQLEAYKDGNKSFNNMLLILGSSMWILILLGLMYVANLNLRNKKIIENLNENVVSLKETNENDNIENKEKIDELNETINSLKEDNKKIMEKLDELLKK